MRILVRAMRDRHDRKTNRIAMNGVLATVSAVHRDFGYVVLKSPNRTLELPPQTPLVLSRGGKRIGEAWVTKIKRGEIVANLDAAQKERILPGDQAELAVKFE